MAKIIQIAATAHRVFALTEDGNVYIYDGVDEHRWSGDLKMEWRKLEMETLND